MEIVKKPPRKNIPHFKIYEYWKDKSITKTGEVVSVGDEHADSPVFVVESDFEPSCWGCGLPILTRLEENQTEGLCSDDLPKIWGDKNVSSDLNRCHIVPRSLGGEDVPSNLFLMCETCHLESPDTSNPYNFMRWVYNRRNSYCMGRLSLRSAYELLDNELKSRGLDTSLEEILKMILEKDPDFDWRSFKQYVNDHVGQHGFETKRVSLINGYVDWFLHSLVEVSLQ